MEYKYLITNLLLFVSIIVILFKLTKVVKLIDNLKIILQRNVDQNINIKTNNNYDEQIDELEKEYIKIITDEEKSKKLYIAMQCFNRLPKSYLLLKIVWNEIKYIIENANKGPLENRDYIADINRLIFVYSENCNVLDIKKTEEIMIEINEISQKIIEELKRDEVHRYELLIKSLEDNMELLSKDTDNTIVLNALEAIDNNIEKSRIILYPEINKKYEQLSEELLQMFKSDQPNEISNQNKQNEYNIHALQEYKRALNYFNKKKGAFQDMTNPVIAIVKIIGKWDNQYLYQTTQAYTNTIYMGIFSKLKADDQYKMTELMIKAEKVGL